MKRNHEIVLSALLRRQVVELEGRKYRLFYNEEVQLPFKAGFVESYWLGVQLTSENNGIKRTVYCGDVLDLCDFLEMCDSLSEEEIIKIAAQNVINKRG